MCHRLHAGPDREDRRSRGRTPPRNLGLACALGAALLGSCAEDTAGGQGTTVLIEEQSPDDSRPTRPRGRFNSNEVVDQRTGTTISMVLQAAERRTPTPLLWQSRGDDEQLARLPRSELLLGVRTANGAAVRTNPRADEARRIERIQCDQIKEQVTSAAQRCTALDCLLVVCAAAQAQANCATLADYAGFTGQVLRQTLTAFGRSRGDTTACLAESKESRRCLAPVTDDAFTIGHEKKMFQADHRNPVARRGSPDPTERISDRRRLPGQDRKTTPHSVALKDWSRYVQYLESELASYGSVWAVFPGLKDMAGSEMSFLKNSEPSRQARCEKAIREAPHLLDSVKSLLEENECSNATLSSESLASLRSLIEPRLQEETAARNRRLEQEAAARERRAAAAAKERRESAKPASTGRKITPACARNCRSYMRCCSSCVVKVQDRGGTMADAVDRCLEPCRSEMTSECDTCADGFRDPNTFREILDAVTNGGYSRNY